MASAAFSSDGSVLAVAAEKVITLWDPDRNTLLAVIGDSVEVSFCSYLLLNSYSLLTGFFLAHIYSLFRTLGVHNSMY